MSGVVGADAMEAAPLLPFRSVGGATPAAGLTEDARDPDYGAAHTAWWRVQVPADHDPANPVRVTATRSYVTTPGDSSASALIWFGDDRATQELIGSGASVDLTMNPGVTFYIEAAVNPGSDTAADTTYVVTVGDVVHTYTGWIQGDDIAAGPIERSYQLAEQRLVQDAAQVTAPTGWFDDGVRDGVANAARAELEVVGDIYPGTGGSPPSGLVIDYGSYSIVRGGSPAGESFSFEPERRDNGAFISGGALATLQDRGGYQSDLNASKPADAVDVELNPEDFRTIRLDASVPITYTGTGRLDPSLYVRTYIRPAATYSDMTGSGGGDLIDERLWQGIGTDVLTFSTSALGPTGGLILMPISDHAATPAWETEVPNRQGSNSWTSNADMRVTIWPGDTITLAGLVRPPRHRYRYDEYRIGETTGSRPHLRQYPRSPLRHWPPERSVQRSNRRAGGYK